MSDFAALNNGTMDSLVTSAVVVWLIQKAKESSLPWLRHVSTDNPGLIRILAAVGATLTAAGLAWTWDASQHTLTITGLTFENAVMFLWLTAKQYVEQYLVYKVGFKPKDSTS